MLIIEHWHNKKSSPLVQKFSSLYTASRAGDTLTLLNYRFLKDLGYRVNQRFNPSRRHNVERT